MSNVAANVGLAVFVAVWAVNGAGLALDGLLLLLGYETVTARVVAGPVLGVPIVLLQVVAVCGIVLHFYARSN